MAESVSQWIPNLRGEAGQADQAADCLCSYFRDPLLTVAKQRLSNLPAGDADEEDVVNAAFHSFFRRAAGGGFPQLRDRDDLWKVLACIVGRKAMNLRRRRRRRLDRMSIPRRADLADRVPEPQQAAIQDEEVQLRLSQLGNPELQRIAQHKLEGWTNLEIAAAVGRSVPTIERRLRLIRNKWLHSTLTQQDEHGVF